MPIQQRRHEPICTLQKETLSPVLNLARLYPQRFVKLELTIEKEDYDYEYKRSLINHMLSMEPIRAVKPNQSMYQLARCWAKEVPRTKD